MRIQLAGLFIASAMLFSFPVAADTATINGTVYTCTNTCVVTINGSTGAINVSDCCGGNVRFRIYPTQQQ